MAVKKYILVGEDDSFYANIYKVKLLKEGFDVDVVADGATLLEMAKKKKPDLVLLDLIMPVKDGFQTLKELKADDFLKDVKVIVMSNLGQYEDKEKALSLGAENYFVKTDISIQQLIEIIRAYL